MDMAGEPARRALVRAIVDMGLDPPAVITVYVTTQLRRYGAKS
jgi:hypothetical protein